MFCKSSLVAVSPESKTDTAFINTNIMKLSVIIPVYNEISTIEALIEKVLKVDIDKEIIVVDDSPRTELVSCLRENVNVMAA